MQQETYLLALFSPEGKLCGNLCDKTTIVKYMKIQNSTVSVILFQG